MEMFSKVQYQPRILTRSSWWITLMLLLACSTTFGASDSSDIDFINKWMNEEYPTIMEPDEKVDWIKSKFKKLLDYDDLIDKYNNAEDQNVFVSRTLNQCAKDFDLSPKDIEKMEKKLFWFKYIPTKSKKDDYFRKILKETVPYTEYINKWKKEQDEEMKKSILSEAFWKFEDVKLMCDRIGFRWTTGDPNSEVFIPEGDNVIIDEQLSSSTSIEASPDPHQGSQMEANPNSHQDSQPVHDLTDHETSSDYEQGYANALKKLYSVAKGSAVCPPTTESIEHELRNMLLECRNVLSANDTIASPGTAVQSVQTRNEQIKDALFARFKKIASKYTNQFDGWFVERNSFDPAKNNMGIRYMMPFSYGKCELCDGNQGLKFRNLINRATYARNCATCGRLLCSNCIEKDKDNRQCCKPGYGCQAFQLPQIEEDQCEGDNAPTASGADSYKYNDKLNPFSQSTNPFDTSSRRLLNGKLSDSSFWEGVLTSLVVLLGSFFAYYFLFITPEESSSRRKTVHIKKKRSTFFKTRSPEKAQTASQVKGAFSTVIRRQLSKLDED